MINGAALFYGLVFVVAPYLCIGLVALLYVILDEMHGRRRRKRR